MALQELDSFVFKFKNLCKSGRNANLINKHNSGKTEVHLSVELLLINLFVLEQGMAWHGNDAEKKELQFMRLQLLQKPCQKR